MGKQNPMELSRDARLTIYFCQAFYINLVIGALFAPAYLFTLPNIDFQTDVPLLQKLRKMDWIAIIIFFGGTTCFTMAISFGGTVYAWNSAAQIVFWCMSGILLIVMTLVTIYHPLVPEGDRLYPAHFVRRPVLVNLQIQLFLITGVMLGTAYYIPLYFQFTRGDSALQAAVRLLPFIAMAVFFSLVNGALMPKLGYYIPWYLFGSALVLIGATLMYTVNPSTSTSAVYGYTVILGIGAGSYLQAGYAVVQLLVPPEEIGNAVGFMSVAQDLGIVFILSLAGAVYQNLALERVRPVLKSVSESDLRLIVAGTSNPMFRSLSPETRTIVIQKITSAMSAVWGVLMAVGALSFVMSWFLGVSSNSRRSLQHAKNIQQRQRVYSKTIT